MLDTLRLAALRVAAMEKADQKWILSRLKREDALRLKLLVKELETLGLENYEDVYLSAAESLREEDTSAVDSNADMERLSTIERWSNASFAELAPELANLSPALRAAIISSYQWPWLNDAIQHFQLARAINPEKIRSNDAVIASLLAQCESQKSAA